MANLSVQKFREARIQVRPAIQAAALARRHFFHSVACDSHNFLRKNFRGCATNVRHQEIIPDLENLLLRRFMEKERRGLWLQDDDERVRTPSSPTNPASTIHDFILILAELSQLDGTVTHHWMTSIVKCSPNCLCIIFH